MMSTDPIFKRTERGGGSKGAKLGFGPAVSPGRTTRRPVRGRGILTRSRPALFICEDYAPDPGGLAAAAYRISRLVATSRKTTVICFEAMDPNRPFTHSIQLRLRNLTVHRLGPFTKGWSPRVDWAGEETRVIDQALRWIISSGAADSESVIIGFGLKSAGLLAHQLRSITKLPLIQCARGNDISRNLFDVSRFPGLRSALDGPDAIVAVNRQLADLILGAFPHLSPRLTIIPNAVSTEFLRAAAKLPKYEVRWKTARYPLGYVGTLREQKNPGLITYLIERVLQPRGALFRVVGSLDNTIRVQCGYSEALPWQHELVSIARAKGPLRLAARIGDILIGIFPSIVEGLSNAMLETAACSVPVVGTEAAAELLALVDHDLVCSPFQPDEVVDLVLEMLSSPSLCNELGEKARLAVLSEFSPEGELERWNSLLAGFDY